MTAGSSVRRLLPVNAAISLARPGDGWPSTLAECGFRLAGLEVPVGAPGKGVTLDAVLVQDSTDQLMTVEAKSGANVAEEQARRLAGLDAASIVRSASVSLTSSGPPPRPISVYVCLEEHQDRIVLGLGRAGVSVAVLAVGPTTISSVGPPFAIAALDDRIGDGVPVSAPPPSYMTVDTGSSRVEFDDAVTAEFVTALAHRRPTMSTQDMLKGVVPFADYLGAVARGRLRRQVESSMRRVALAQADHAVFRERTATRDEAHVEFTATPEDADPRGRTQGYQAVARRAGRPPRNREHPGQGALDLDLIDELDAGDQSGDDDASQ